MDLWRWRLRGYKVMMPRWRGEKTGGETRGEPGEETRGGNDKGSRKETMWRGEVVGEGEVEAGGREGSKWVGNRGGRAVGKAQVNGESRGGGEGSGDKGERGDKGGTKRDE